MCKMSCSLISCVVVFHLLPVTITHGADQNLILWWPLDEGTERVVEDWSGYVNEGVTYGHPLYVPGWSGGALQLDGADDYVIASDFGVLLTEPFSVGAWIYGDTRGRVIFSQPGGANWLMASQSAGYLKTELTRPAFSSHKPVANSEWHHVALAWDGAAVLLYVDGEEVARSSERPTDICRGSFYVGCGSDGGACWNGMIDDLKIQGLEPAKASRPQPADGVSGVTTTTFQWGAGAFAESYDVYLGTSPELTAADLVAGSQPAAAYDHALSLEPGVTYYWRVDQRDAFDNVYVGNVWSFSAGSSSNGALTEYWANQYFWGEPDVVKTVPEVNFDWGGGIVPGENSPDPNIPVDHFSCRWTAELQVPVTGSYVLYQTSDDGARTYLNGQLVMDGWYDRSATEDATGPLELVAGDSYLLMMEMYENGGHAAASLKWEALGIIPKEIIPPDALQPPRMATGPSPTNGAINVPDVPLLQWRPVADAAHYEIYLGIDAKRVRSSDPGVLLGVTSEDTFALGGTDIVLDRNAQYYWKVDTMLEGGTLISGQLWSFTVVDPMIVTPADVTRPGDPVVAVPPDGNWPGNEIPPFAFDNDIETAHFHYFDDLEQPTGFRITPSVGPTIVTGLTFTTADLPATRDPVSFELSGSNEGIDGPYVLIAAGDIVDFAQEDPWPRFTKTKTKIDFENDVVYSHYQLLFPGVRDPSGTSDNHIQIAQDNGGTQIAEAELLGKKVCLAGPCDVYLAGVVRNILDGRQINHDGKERKVTLERKPCKGFGKLTHRNRDPNWYEIEVAAGGCWDFTVYAPDFQTRGPITIWLRADTHTLRDFVLWPKVVSNPPSNPFYRFQWRSGPSSYYFTADEREMGYLLFDDNDVEDAYPENRDPFNWRYDGVACCVWDANTLNPALLKPVYRFLHKSNAYDIPAYAFDINDLEKPTENWEKDSNYDEPVFYAYQASENGELLPQPDDTILVSGYWSDAWKCYAYFRQGEQVPTDGDWKLSNIAWYACDDCP